LRFTASGLLRSHWGSVPCGLRRQCPDARECGASVRGGAACARG
jgi:hypothetical protein